MKFINNHTNQIDALVYFGAKFMLIHKVIHDKPTQTQTQTQTETSE